VATTEKTYVDPSALARLYIAQEGSRDMFRWRAKNRGVLQVTHHGRVEIVNAIALSFFRRDIDADDAAHAWAELELDFLDGHYSQADLLWRAALDRAAELSRLYSPKLGTRSMDVLHVSCALELKLRYFVSFDERQSELAKAVGLKVISI
jgi:predicted nucleic acid-binding protein